MATMVLEVKKKVRKTPVKKAIKKVVSEVDGKIAISIELIEKKAYELYEKRGCQHGDALQDWLEAKKILGAIE